MTRLLAEMTWPEVERAITTGATTVILPLGATEQHGPHLPLGTDSIRAASLAEGLAKVLPGSLVAPVVPVGCSDEHTGFAGLLSLDHETLAQLIVDCGRRMAAWGVRRLVLLSAHGGNDRALELARTRLQEQANGLKVHSLASSNTLSEACTDIASADGIPSDDVGLHAGEGETSEMLHLRPELVRTDRLVAGYTGPMIEVVARLYEVGLRGVTHTGTLGDPRAACADRGARYFAAQIDGYRRMLAAEVDPAAAGIAEAAR
jgi:mycofactocin precursor peptide peptidase